MSNYYSQQPYGPNSAQNLQFYSSSYSPAVGAGVSGTATPQQANYGYGGSQGFGSSSGAGFGGVSGRMGDQSGLRTGWLAAFSTEGYDGEPPLLEELGLEFRSHKDQGLFLDAFPFMPACLVDYSISKYGTYVESPPPATRAHPPLPKKYRHLQFSILSPG